MIDDVPYTLRLLAVDVLGFVIPVATAVVAFVLGRAARRWPRRAWLSVVACVLASAVGAATVALLETPEVVAEPLSRLGGVTVVLSWTALFLLGAASLRPAGSFSARFLGMLACVAALLVVIESAGALWWRFCAAESWDRRCDPRGCLQQSSGLTCAPATACMLLRHYGINASEGELAYLAGTSLFGTDGPAIARALRLKVEPFGLQVRLERPQSMPLRRPFLAVVRSPNLGHALLVERLLVEQVTVVDPLDGERRHMARAAFDAAWTGTALYLERARRRPAAE